MEKQVVHFYSEGSRLEGDLFLPSDLQRRETTWHCPLSWVYWIAGTDPAGVRQSLY